MQQYTIPQFIDVEDKIFGPVTTRQFLILLVTGLLLFVIYKLADFTLFVTLSVILGSIAIIVAFVKVNGQTFHYFVLNIFQTMRKPSTRIWRKVYSTTDLNYLRKSGIPEEKPVEQKKSVPRRAHIRDLALTVNTGGYYKPEE